MILAIDTATRWLGLALLDPDAQAIVWSLGQITLQNQTVTCAARIAEGLAACAAEPSDLQGIAVAIGPGSYTGLRIGLGVAKGLALASGAAILSVPTFEIWAAALPQADEPLLLTATAGRQRLIAAPHVWAVGSGRWEPSAEPDIVTLDTLLEQLVTPWVVAGELSAEARRQLNHHPLTRPLPPAQCVRRPEILAQLGAHMLARGETVDAATVAPRYLRKPQGS